MSFRLQKQIAMPTKSRRKGQMRTRKVSRITGFNPSAGLFPDHYSGKMTYGAAFTFSIAASSMQATVMRLNSVYDPDFSGTGTNAAGYLSAIGIYGRYRVLSADVEVEASLTGNFGLQFFAVASCDSTLGTDYPRAVAQRHFYGKGLPYGGPPLKQKFHVPIHSVYGVPAIQVKTEDDFAGLPGGSPNNPVFLHLGAYNANASVGTMLVTVRIVYNVVWSLPLLITQP